MITKRNFSDLDNLDDLRTVCTKHVAICDAVPLSPKSDDLSYMKKLLFANEEDYELAKSKWPKLFWSHEDKNSKFPTIYDHFSDLVDVVRNNPEQTIYKNGAVKSFLYFFMKIGSYAGHKKGERSYFYTRMSTTTDPRTDACGLRFSSQVHSKKREDALNGEHYIIIVLCSSNVDMTAQVYQMHWWRLLYQEIHMQLGKGKVWGQGRLNSLER